MKSRVLCLAGPTASGKSAVAMALARELPLEIVSVDSAQVYRGLDNGTAKPSRAEKDAVPHHLIDILEPSEAYSAARFAADAEALVAQINARGRVALLVGGTMLYFKALRDGLHAMPAADAAVRAEIESRAARLGWPALHAELARVDAPTAARLAPADAQRIQRALEVWQLSGVPISQWQSRGNGPSGARAAAEWPLVSLEPESRAWLHERISLRLGAMLDAGLMAEVRALRARGDLHARLPAMRCVGYRQAWQALERGSTSAPADEVAAATRQLAKRQLTWLRSIAQRHVVPCDHRNAMEMAVGKLVDLARGAASAPPG